jgi:hypothetical protein
MNASLLAVLNDPERLLVAEIERAPLAVLDEDATIELETRIRRARNKYVGQYRRAARPRSRAAGPIGRERRARSSGQAPAPWVPGGRRSGTADDHRPV